MIDFNNMNTYNIFKCHVICCAILILISFLIQITYIILNIIVLTENSFNCQNMIIWVYNLLSVICTGINIITNIVFYYFHNQKFKFLKTLMCTLNFILFIVGIIAVSIYNIANNMLNIAITGIIIQILTSSIYLLHINQI